MKYIILISYLIASKSFNPSINKFFNIFVGQQDSVGLRKSNLLMQSKYVPPEKDPEYANRLALPNLMNNILNVNGSDAENLPAPNEGDVVQYSRKWPGDKDYGMIRFLTYNDVKKTWVADVVPLKEGKSENVYTVDRDARSYFFNIEDLKPVRSFFVRSENGYKLAMKPNSTEAVLKAESYRILDDKYRIPKKVIYYEIL